MRLFQNPEIKTVLFHPKDILTASEETETTQSSKTSPNGEIITPPDEFEDD